MLALLNFGLIQTNRITLHFIQIGSSLEMLLLSFALADRINILRREKDQAHEHAMAVKQGHGRHIKAIRTNVRKKVLERTRTIEEANQKLREKEALLLQMALHDHLTGLLIAYCWMKPLIRLLPDHNGKTQCLRYWSSTSMALKK